MRLFDDVTHSQIVTTILREWGGPDRLHLHRVDGPQGAVDRDRYLEALGQIQEYLQEEPTDRVVINISLGSYAPVLTEKQLIEDLVQQGAIVVAAAGNHGAEKCVYPAALEGVICVGASEDGVRRDYSNYGDIDVFADGSYHLVQRRAVPSDAGIETHKRTVKLNGTSFAAPRVAGLVVKMLRLKPSLGKRQIQEILQTTSDDVLDFEQGCINRLDALAAISGKHAALRKVEPAVLVFIEVVCIVILICIGLLIAVPIPEFLFRVLFPSRWIAVKMARIDKIMANDARRPRDIRYLIDCLRPGYNQLHDKAYRVLLCAGEPAVKHLVRAYPYKTHDEFGDFKTCVYDLIRQIGGPEADAFLRSEHTCHGNPNEPRREFEGA